MAAKEKGLRVQAALRGVHAGPPTRGSRGKARRGIRGEWAGRRRMERLAHQKGASFLDLVSLQGLDAERAAHCEGPLHAATAMRDVENRSRAREREARVGAGQKESLPHDSAC
eukprot:9159116-Pyramimonas_sp.AAC.1